MTPESGRRTLSEEAHEADGAVSVAEAPARPVKRNFNEAAHKLGHWPVRPEAPKERAPSAAMRAATDDERDVVAHAGKAVLALGALGIVFGDIGTSPLYTEQFIFTAHRNAAHPNVAGVYGIASLIFWTLMIEVSLKYAGFIMRAHNRGDGGIMALTALVQRKRIGRTFRAGDAGHLRRRTVLRRRHDHAGDQRDLGGRRPQRGQPQPRPSRGPPLAGHPRRPVRGPALRHRRRGLAVRPGHPAVLRGHRGGRPAPGGPASRGDPGPVAGLGAFGSSSTTASTRG